MPKSGRRWAFGSVTINPRAIKPALPNSAHPIAAPEDPANEHAARELPRPKQTPTEHTGLEHTAVPLTFEQSSPAIDRIRPELLVHVEFASKQDQSLISVLRRQISQRPLSAALVTLAGRVHPANRTFVVRKVSL
jgi:hypothetical protein